MQGIKRPPATEAITQPPATARRDDRAEPDDEPCEASRVDVVTLEGPKEPASNLLSSLRRELSRLQQQAAAVERTLDDQRRDRSDALERFERATEHALALEGRLTSAEAEITSLRRMHESALAELERAREARDTLERALSEAKAAANDGATAKKEIADAKQQVEAAKKEVATAKNDADAAKKEAGAARAEAEAAKKDAKDAKKGAEAARADAENAKKDAEAAKKEAAQAGERAEEAERARSGLEAELAEAKKRAFQEALRLTDKEAEIAELRASADGAEARAGTAEARAEAAEQARAAVEEAMRALRDEVLASFARAGIGGAPPPPIPDAPAQDPEVSVVSLPPELAESLPPDAVSMPPMPAAPPPLPPSILAEVERGWSSPPAGSPESRPPQASSAPPPRASSAPPPRASSAPPPRASSAPPPRASSAPPPRASSAPPSRAITAPPPRTSSAPPSLATPSSPPEDLVVGLTDPARAAEAAERLREHPEWLRGIPPTSLIRALSNVDYDAEGPVFDLARSWEREPLCHALLLSLRAEHDVKLREHGAWLLKHLAAPSAWKTIADLARSEDEPAAVRRWLLEALDRLAAGRAIGWRELGDVVSQLSRHPDASLRDGVVGVLMSLDKSEEKRRLLLDVLRLDDDEVVLASAVHALVSILPVELDPAVVERLLGHPSPRVQRSVRDLVDRARRSED